MHEINDFFEKKEKNNIIKCALCPHNCKINTGKKGVCGTRINDNGRFYSLVYGRPSAINIDPIEKKPLYHFYPGSDILSIGTLGCNLFCRGCQNYDISKGPIIKLPKLMPEEVVSKAKENNLQMIAYTYNEPTIFYEYMMDIAKLAKREKIKNVMVSNGFINDAPLKKLIKYIDATNIDLKGFDERFYKEYANAHLSPILKNLKTIKNSDIWLEVTNLLIPGLNDDEKNLQKMCTWINTNIKDTPLHFSRFFPYYKAQNIKMTSREILAKAKETANNSGIDYVYIGNTGIMENTYCHYCKNLLIIRHPKIKIVGITKGKCDNCRKKVPGIFN